MNILVTGGAGYIGSHVCKALSDQGFTPITYDNLSYGDPFAVKWGPLVEGDLFDKRLLKKTFEQYKPTGVIHLAALTNARESADEPIKYYQNNVEGTLNLLKEAKENGVSYCVFSSTCAVYGMPQKIPIDESHPINPINNYGRSKMMAEQLLQTAAPTFGMKLATLRYFNAAGADLDGEIGEKRSLHTHLIPLLLQVGLEKRGSFTIFGDDHPTLDGTPIRDYVHVSDLAKAHILSLKWMIKHQENLTLNLGSGCGYSVKNVIAAIEKMCSFTIPTKISKSFPGDPPSLVANFDKATQILGWRPKYSDLTTILETALKWHQK